MKQPARTPNLPTAARTTSPEGHARRLRHLAALVALAASGLGGLPAQAADAEAQRMIDALRPAQASTVQAAPGTAAESGQPGPANLRTRALRNLRVETAPGQADAAAAAAAVAPTAAESAAAAAPRSLSLTIGFEFDSAQITPTSADTLSSLAQALQSSDLQSLNFRIEGHTDRRGRPDYNLRLSQQRAEAVRAYLAKLGVPNARLVAEGRGDTDPANPADPLAAENRRVRIVTLGR